MLRVIVPKALWGNLEVIGRQLRELVGDTEADSDDSGEIALRLIFRKLTTNPELLATLVPAECTTRIVGLEDGPEALTRGGIPSSFDMRLLHTSSKVKSGYHGVAAYSSGYQARVRSGPHNIGLTPLGTFKTPQLAAHARFVYYLRHENLAYGEAESELEAMRKMAPALADQTDEQLWPEVLDYMASINRTLSSHSFSMLPGPRQPQIDAWLRMRDAVANAPMAPVLSLFKQLPEPKLFGLEDVDPGQFDKK